MAALSRVFLLPVLVSLPGYCSINCPAGSWLGSCTYALTDRWHLRGCDTLACTNTRFGVSFAARLSSQRSIEASFSVVWAGQWFHLLRNSSQGMSAASRSREKFLLQTVNPLASSPSSLKACAWVWFSRNGVALQSLSWSHYSLISLAYLLWWSAQIDMTAE